MNYHRREIIKQLDRLILAFPRPKQSEETIKYYLPLYRSYSMSLCFNNKKSV